MLSFVPTQEAPATRPSSPRPTSPFLISIAILSIMVKRRFSWATEAPRRRRDKGPSRRSNPVSQGTTALRDRIGACCVGSQCRADPSLQGDRCPDRSPPKEGRLLCRGCPLDRDLYNKLSKEKGFSERDIKRLLAFYHEYLDLEFVSQPVAQIEPTKKEHRLRLFSRLI